MSESVTVSPKGFSQLKAQNQSALSKVIEAVLYAQERGIPAKVELNIADGGILTDVQPKYFFKIQAVK